MQEKKQTETKTNTEIEYPKIYAKQDKKIQKLLFPDEPLQRYSYDRNLGGKIVEAIYFGDEKIRLRFGEIIDAEYKDLVSRPDIIDTPSMFILVFTSERICYAAIKAIEESNQQ